MAEDKASKKHPASQQKLKQLKKKGQVPKSTDVPMAAGLLAAFAIMFAMRNFYLRHFDGLMKYCIESLGDIKSSDGIDITNLCLFAIRETLMLSAPVLIAVLIVAVLSNLAMTGIIITGEQLKPNFNKLNPMTKMKQWFSIKSLQELGKSLAKILAAGYIGFSVWKGAMTAIAESVKYDPAGLLSFGGALIFQMFWKIMILYLVVALFDYIMQRKNFNTEQKMTDKEVRDEYKNQEGDPYMKQKRRQMAQQIAMQQSQDGVQHSDVVVINPTELAVALKYDPDISPVPYVISKGEKRHADDIRESARKHGIPIVRNKPLARGLHELCEIGDLVPEDLYRPVAEVLAYVFGLRETAGAAVTADAGVEAAAIGADTASPVSAAHAGMAGAPVAGPGRASHASTPFTWSPLAGNTGVHPSHAPLQWAPTPEGSGYKGPLAEIPVYNSSIPSYAGDANPTAPPIAHPNATGSHSTATPAPGTGGSATQWQAGDHLNG